MRSIQQKVLFVTMMLVFACFATQAIGQRSVTKEGICESGSWYLKDDCHDWYFGIRGWAPYLDKFDISVLADGHATAKGYNRPEDACPNILLKCDDGTFQRRQIIWGNGWTTYTETDRRYFLDPIVIQIHAPDGLDWLDWDARITVKQLCLKLYLKYDGNAVEVDGAPKVVDFGTIDLGMDHIQNITIRHIGDNPDPQSWEINEPVWIANQNGTVANGSAMTVPLQMLKDQIQPGNVAELNGKLVPISGAEAWVLSGVKNWEPQKLDPKVPGLKGDFYHLPNTNLSNLDAALSSSDKSLVYSAIFPKIEFNKGKRESAFSEPEDFKTGTISVPVRRDFVARFTGFIKITAAGEHKFFVSSDDGFRLKVNDVMVTEFPEPRGTATSEGTIYLETGFHPIELTFFQGAGYKSLTLEWQPPDSFSPEVVPQSVLYNGLNVLVKATPQKPTVLFTTPTGSNGKVNIPKRGSFTFQAQATPGSTGVHIAKYRWQKVSGSDRAGPGFDQTTAGEKEYPFLDSGDFTIYCQVVDEKGVESEIISIPVRVWNRPVVFDTPPADAIPGDPSEITRPDKVSWLTGKYIGEVNQPVRLRADGETTNKMPDGTPDPSEYIDRYIWDFDNDWKIIERIQPATKIATHVWSTASPSGRIWCKAVNNYDVESDEKLFDLKIYDSLQVDAGGPYTGRPGRPVRLEGSINKTSYPGAAFKYRWYVKDGGDFSKVDTSKDGIAEYAWANDGGYEGKFEATVTTSEGLVLTGSDIVFVVVESGRPTTVHGGPYRGGIYGGNFSPVQFRGNSPDFAEADDVGLIWGWVWYFPDRMGMALQLDGADDYLEVPAADEYAVEMWVKPDAKEQMGLYSGNYDIFIYEPGGLGGNADFDNTFGLYIALDTDNGIAIPFNDIKDGWHYIAVSWNRGTQSITVSIDGQFPGGRVWDGNSWTAPYAAQGQKPFTLPAVPQPDANATIQIGRTGGLLWSTGSQYFNGVIDEVAIWNVALTEYDILLHLSMSSNLGGDEKGLCGYWRLDEGEGNTAYDSVENNEGTLFGMGPGNWVADGHPSVVMGPPEDKLPANANIPAPANGFWNATHVYRKAGIYEVSLRVRSEYGKWSWADSTQVKVIDGMITGYVRAADLRTPVKRVKLYLTSSHVYSDALAAIAASDDSLNTTADGGLWTETDENGYYAFEHIPLGSYRIRASKAEGETIHEFETNPKVTGLTLDTPNQLAVDFVDLSVFPISGRIVYSIQKNGVDVLVKDVVVEAQAVGSTNSIKSLPSTKSGDATGSNYRLPLFSGKYLFLANLSGHDIRIKEDTPDYDRATELVTIDRARTDIDFIDHTTRELTVFVQDSGGYKMPGRGVFTSGDNGQAEGISDDQYGKFVAVLPPGKYTVTVPGADPETQEVDMTGGDQAVTMTIPVKIELSIGPRPKLFDVPDEFLEHFGLEPEDNPEGYMYYYPPEPRTHTYTITATANGNPVEDFTLFVTDEVSMTTEDPPAEQGTSIQGEEGEYTITAGLPRLDWSTDLPVAAPKRVTFRAEKEGYLDSDPADDMVTVLGDVPVGSAAKIVSVPVVNYTVLHDPPGDSSYSYFDDSMTLKGMVSDMQIEINDTTVTVYPSPWRDERTIEDFAFEKDPGSETEYRDLGDKGLLDYESPADMRETFAWMAVVEMARGGVVSGLAGPFAYAAQIINAGVSYGMMNVGIQYEVSPHRRLTTTIADDVGADLIPDLIGPGKGDIYFGEGWTLGLQMKYRVGVKLVTDSKGDPILDKQGKKQWTLHTEQIETYDILERTNQYVYTIRDIENIISDLERTIPQTTDQNEKSKLTNARNTWEDLLNKNLAYIWNRDYVSQGISFEEFREREGSNLGPCETLIFSAGPNFEYSRTIAEGDIYTVSVDTGPGTTGSLGTELEGSTGWRWFGTGIILTFKAGGSSSVDTGTSLSKQWQGGKEAEQSVGFVLNDDDVGDNISTRIYADPVWGTPLFFQDPGSVTSDPWEAGTSKAIDVSMELTEGTVGSAPFDYNDSANYEVKVTYTGVKELETHKFDFELLAPPALNPDGAYVEFNGYWGPYPMKLAKGQESANVVVSVSPPKNDLGNSEEKEYSLVIQVREVDDEQITRILTLKPRFADLRAPRATVVAPYAGQRISPVFFPQTDPFDIEVVSNDTDLDSIQLQIRTKQPDGVWEPWRKLSGMVWQDGGPNTNVEMFDRLDRDPPRREFTFKWTESEIKALGVGEYALRAVAKDKATNPNTDIDPPDVVFLVDDSKPTVLTTIPDYQAREKERTYRGELSALFTDDMRADDFSDRTFAVTDLLKGGQKVAGFVSYSPALRKAIFVPVVPFISNGLYRVEIRTDTDNKGVIERGVHDLAGNPLDNAFMWTFRTKDTPFEETWSITLSVTDGKDIDANNIAAVEYGALDDDEEEDEKDARSVPALTSQLRLSFLNRDKEEFDRDIRPADGRLSHHWFFVIGNAPADSQVTINYKPSIKLTRVERQYQILRLVEFKVDSSRNVSVSNVIPLDPTEASIDPATGEILELEAYTYTNQGETSRYFRLDIQKADLVATTFKTGSSGWKFFSAPITPQRADPFINLGDDIDPFQMYRYDTQTGGYKIYPLDLGEVSLQTGHGYFTRLNYDAAVDVGGSSNMSDVTLKLEAEGWHAIGNPFPVEVDVTSLEIKKVDDPLATVGDLVEITLYRWKTDGAGDMYEDVSLQPPQGTVNQLLPWEGYWIKTRQDNVTLTIPAPSGLDDAYKILPDSYKPPVMAPPAADSRRIAVQPGEFDLRLELTSNSSADTTTTLGARQKARMDWDPMDQSEPPILGETVAAYFHHPDWGDDSGSYNRDYQPVLNVGGERTWRVTVYTDKPDSQMKLSWEESISQVPDDVMIYFRRADTGTDDDWQDMRKVRSIDLESRLQFTSIPMEIRAQRYEMRPPSGVQVTPGEKLVTLRWEPDDSEFIEGYIITRQNGSAEGWREGEGVSYTINNSSEFVDRDVLEEVTYTYQLRVRFMSGAELGGRLLTVRTLPVIKQTALMRCYPNPFNPEVWIPYDLAEEASVSVEIYSASGQLVRTLDLGVQQRGRYASRDKAAYWDGLNQAGERAASGVYFYVLKAGKFSASKKMVLIR